MKDEGIKSLFDKYRDSDYETFEEYMEKEQPDIQANRVFVDSEIIVD